MSMMVSFVLSFFPRDVLDEILNLIESVSEDFPSYSCKHGQKSCKLLLTGLISNLAKFRVLCKTTHCRYASAIDTYF